MKSDELRFDLSNSLLDSTSHGLLWLDKEGFILNCNRGFEFLFGYKKEEITGKSAALFFVPMDVQDKVPEQEMMIARSEGMAANDRWQIRKDQSLLWIIGVMEPIRDKSGEVQGFVKIIRDMTREKIQLEELRRSNKELQDYAHTTAHDMQSPINKISAYTDLLLTELGASLTEKAASYLDRIKFSLARLSDIVTTVLRFAKATSSEYEFEEIDMNAVLNAVLSEYELSINERQAKIQHDPLPKVSGRFSQMVQVFSNLISNGLKYGGETPAVSITAFEKDDGFVFKIHNSGPSIPPSERERVFQLFYRSKMSGKSEAGSGIGLAICKNIIEQYGGKIWVESEPDQGVDFFFTLPRKRPSQPEPNGKQKPSAFDTRIRT